MGVLNRIAGLQKTSCQGGGLPPSFELEIKRLDKANFMLTASQLIPLPPEEAFGFFRDPRNLAAITPGWLGFRMLDGEGKAEVFEGAEFDYTIRWLGRRLRWRGKIEGYNPPRWFTDVQAQGPYRRWSHLHVFARVPQGTLMKDEVIYRLPHGALGRWLHRKIVKRQLEDIFCYRAVKIHEWSEARRKG